MMTSTADPELPLDLRGKKLSLSEIKEFIREDVAALQNLSHLKALDDARRAANQISVPNRRLDNLVEMWEKAHDRHWSWYRAGLDAEANGS